MGSQDAELADLNKDFFFFFLDALFLGPPSPLLGTGEEGSQMRGCCPHTSLVLSV